MGKTGERAVVFHLPRPLPGADRVIVHPEPCSTGPTLSLSLVRGFEGAPLEAAGLKQDRSGHVVGLM